MSDPKPYYSGFNSNGNRYYVYPNGQYSYDNQDESYYSHRYDDRYDKYVNSYTNQDYSYEYFDD